MGFKSMRQSDKTFELVKLHVKNTEGFIKKYCILDFKKVTPFHFTCPVCKQSNTNIDYSDAGSFNPKKIKIDELSLTATKSLGTICKLIVCETCDTYYFVSIGYIEPNYGRDVLLLDSIIELKII